MNGNETPSCAVETWNIQEYYTDEGELEHETDAKQEKVSRRIARNVKS